MKTKNIEFETPLLENTGFNARREKSSGLENRYEELTSGVDG